MKSLHYHLNVWNALLVHQNLILAYVSLVGKEGIPLSSDMGPWKGLLCEQRVNILQIATPVEMTQYTNNLRESTGPKSMAQKNQNSQLNSCSAGCVV